MVFVRDWSAVIPAGEYERAQTMEDRRPAEQALTHPAYADVHEFDRAAIADFARPDDLGLPRRLVDLSAQRHPDLSSPVGTARRAVIAYWCDRTGRDLPDSLCSRAGQYLDSRGYPMATLLDLAEPLRTLSDGLTVRVGATLRTFADRGEILDDLDYVIACLHAGLSAPEISAHLRSGAWPDPDALAVLGALR